MAKLSKAEYLLRSCPTNVEMRCRLHSERPSLAGRPFQPPAAREVLLTAPKSLRKWRDQMQAMKIRRVVRVESCGSMISSSCSPHCDTLRINRRTELFPSTIPPQDAWWASRVNESLSLSRRWSFLFPYPSDVGAERCHPTEKRVRNPIGDTSPTKCFVGNP